MTLFICSLYAGGIFGARKAGAGWLVAITWPSALGFALAFGATHVEKELDR